MFLYWLLSLTLINNKISKKVIKFTNLKYWITPSLEDPNGIELVTSAPFIKYELTIFFDSREKHINNIKGWIALRNKWGGIQLLILI